MKFGIGAYTLSEIKNVGDGKLKHYRLFERMIDTNLTILAHNINEAANIAEYHEEMLYETILVDEVIVEESKYMDTWKEVKVLYKDTNGRYDNYIIACLYRGMKENEYPDIDTWVNTLINSPYSGAKYYALTHNTTLTIEDEELLKVYNRHLNNIRNKKINNLKEIINFNKMEKNIIERVIDLKP